ncbi:hypothetical protein P6166_00350 [Stenotrophomonas sp. HITSZ_GD]|uniref:hypothetical protein n=1 Tax=Stenotrophomonas sp. HITSZ_GD TaxID=3037248 RepID=UPI00240DC3AF|nr:hypothetical protein [Stenotrophomonas sp. HITSZ_GD]MDG2523810.1 hypothetical protein [Stenotrophomonas sp. HITSZ_GD]
MAMAALLALLDALLWRLPMFIAIAVGMSLLLRARGTPSRRMGLLGLALCLASVLVDALLGMLPMALLSQGAATSLVQLGPIMRGAGVVVHLLLAAGVLVLCWALARTPPAAPTLD